MRTTAARLRAEGKLEGKMEGKLEGKEEGRAEGRAEIVRQLFDARFGPLSRSAKSRIAAAKSGDLEAWAIRCLTAGSLDDVFAPR